jgi:hypothetical protein
VTGYICGVSSAALRLVTPNVLVSLPPRVGASRFTTEEDANISLDNNIVTPLLDSAPIDERTSSCRTILDDNSLCRDCPRLLPGEFSFVTIRTLQDPPKVASQRTHARQIPSTNIIPNQTSMRCIGATV